MQRTITLVIVPVLIVLLALFLYAQKVPSIYKTSSSAVTPTSEETTMKGTEMRDDSSENDLSTLHSLYTSLLARFDSFTSSISYVNTISSSSSDSLTNTPTPIPDITLFPYRSHSSLTNLTNSDDHTQYLYGSGRAGGQTLVGGTNANDILTLQSSSATTGTSSGEKALKINVGSGGETEALTILNNGSIGFQKTNPGFTLDVGGIVNATAFYVNGAPYVGSQWSTSGSSIFYTTGTVGIGTSAPSQTLDIAGTLKTTGLIFPTGAVSGYVLTTDANGVASWTAPTASGGDWTLSGNNLFPNSTSNNIAIGASGAGSAKLYVNGNVGIGTTNPSGSLDVNGQGIFRDNTYIFPAGANGVYLGNGQMLTLDESGLYDAGGDVPLAVYTSDQQLARYGNGGNLSIDNSGNVGIGTTSPSSPLDVNGITWLRGAIGGTTGLYVSTSGDVGVGTTNPTANLEVKGSGNASYAMKVVGKSGAPGQGIHLESGNGSWGFYDPGGAGGDIVLKAGYGGESEYSSAGKGGSIFINPGVGYGNGNIILANQTGNVGIGTTAPTQALHVVGSARITGALYDSSNSAGSSTNILTSTGTGTAWSSLSSALDTSYFKQNGNSFTALAVLGTNDAYGLAFETSGTERLRVDTSGNVGIGTTSPLAKLDVKDSSSLTQQSAEMITNTDDRTFGSDLSHWSGTGWTIGSSVSTHTAGANAYTLSNTYLSSAPVASNVYVVSVTVNTTTTGTLTIAFGGSTVATVGQTTGTIYPKYFVTATNTNPLTLTPNATWEGTIDWVTIKQITNTASVALQLTPSDGTSNPIEFRTGASGSTAVSIGYQAGQYADSYNNADSVGIGYQALRYAQDGSNVAVGSYALRYGTNIALNAAVGTQALVNLNYGYNNNVMGYYSLANVREGQNNVAVGSGIGSNASNVYNFNDNVLLGFRSAYQLGSGSQQNILIGTESGYNLTSATGNVFLGYQSGYSETGSNKLYIDNSSTTSPLIWGDFSTNVVNFNGSVGIGTTAPTQALHVVGSARITGALYDSSNSAGSSTNILTSTGTGTAWTTVSSAFDTTYFKQGGNSFTGLATLGTNDAYGLAFETSGTERLRVDTSGNVGIGTTNPRAQLTITGETLGFMSTSAERARRDVYNPSGTWVNTGSTMATSFYSASSAVIGDYIYIFGGQGKNAIQKAPVRNPTAWVDTGATLPSNLGFSSLAVIGDYIYLFGGWTTVASNIIYRAPISNPTAWVDTGSTLPGNVLNGGQLEIIKDTIYYFGGDGNGSIYSAPVSNPTSWTDTTIDMPADVAQSPTVVIGDYIYIFGGAIGLSTTSNIYRAPITNPTSWTDTGADMPAAFYRSSKTIIGDYIYSFGGTSGASIDDIYRAPLSNPLAWETTGDLIPGNLTGSSVHVIGDYVYLFGGSNTNVIYRAGIRSSEESKFWKYAADTQKNQYQSLSTAISSNGAGNIGIGTTNPGYTLDVKSTGTDIARFIGSNSTGCTLSDGGIIACSSDRNLKKNIVNTNLGLDAVMNLRPVEFNWNSQANGDKKYLGFIAQEVEQVAPDLVTIDSNGYRQLNSIGLIPIVAKAVQEQQGFINTLQANAQVPDTKIATVSSKLETLNAKVGAWDGLFISIQSVIQSIQDSILALRDQFGLVQTDIISTKSEVASLSASLTALNSWKEAMASGSGVLGASDFALLDHVATVSALTVQNQTTTFDLTVLNKLTTGVIELGAGIDGDEINASTGIRFQTLSQGPIDFMNGKVIIDVDGGLKAVAVSADRYAASKARGSVGLGLLKAGKTSISITTPLVNENSRIFVTALTKTNKPLYVSAVVDGSHFVVSLAETPIEDIRFNWWIVEEE